MSIMDSLYNLVGYTKNERKRDEYKKALEKLSEYQSKIENYTSECREAYKGFELVHNYGINNNLNGEAIDTFKGRSAKIHQNNLSYISQLENASSIMSEKVDKAREVYQNYCRKCEEEEAAKKAKQNKKG